MRIAIDGFNLGLKQGTGLATYARELSHVLQGAGHEVFPIYGLGGLRREPTLVWPSFIQTLANTGEAASGDYKRWLWAALKYVPHILLPTQGVALSSVPVDIRVESGVLKAVLPSFNGIYNGSGLFRAAQSYTLLLNYPLKIRMPEGGLDALHLTCPLPIRMPGVKMVMTVHDIIPLLLPHSTQMNLRHYRRMLATSFAQADMIFCISETTKRDISTWFGVPESKLHLTYQAVNLPQQYRQLNEEQVVIFLRNQFKLEYGGYFLYFGAIEPKKNVARVIDAMRMAQTDLPLVIVGKDGWLFDDVQARLKQDKKQEKIRRIEYLPFEQLMYLVRGAKALIFPSLYEGFGLPVLEAMQLGCPVITANTTALAEVAGDAALTVDPLDTGAIRAAIELLDRDEGLRRELVEKGYQQVQKFSPEKHAERLAEGYAKAGLKWG